MNALLDRIAFLFVCRLCGCSLLIPPAPWQCPVPGGATDGGTTNDHVSNASPGRQSDLQKDSGHYRFGQTDDEALAFFVREC